MNITIRGSDNQEVDSGLVLSLDVHNLVQNEAPIYSILFMKARGYNREIIASRIDRKDPALVVVYQSDLLPSL